MKNNLVNNILNRAYLKLLLEVYSKTIKVESTSKIKFFLELKNKLNSIPKDKFPLEFKIESDNESRLEIYSFYTVNTPVPFLNLTAEQKDGIVYLDIVPF